MMTVWRSLSSWVVCLVVAAAAQAQTYTLQEEVADSNHFRVKLNMQLQGELRIQQDGKETTLKQSATAAHDYVERTLQAAEHGMIGLAARHYREAKAVIRVGDTRSERTFRDDRRVMLSQRGKDGLITYCLKGPLTREELDLCHHFDSMAVTGLLPNKAVAVGDSWKLHNAVAQALCHFDGLTSHNLTGTLVSVSGKSATVAVNGHASGIERGAAVALQIDGSLEYDLEAGRVTSLQWTQKDEREQGPVSPAMKATVTIKMTREKTGGVVELNDLSLGAAVRGQAPAAALLNLAYADAAGRYTLAPARDWIMVARTDQHLVLRLLDRGDFVAQATVTVWPKAEPGKHMSADDFKAAMAESPGWEQEEVLEAGELKLASGNWCYRLATAGKLNGLKTVQYFYLVTGTGGDQLVVAFTMTPAQVSKLGDRDQELVRSVTFPSVKRAE